VHIVPAWAEAGNLVLAQCKIEAKSNKTTAIPEWLHLLELSGATVTIEDQNRKRAGNAAGNFSLLNHIPLNLFRQDKSSRLGIHGKRLAATWDHNYLLSLISGSN
jgi:predicted transposase YbfD/YdcC